MGIFEPYRAIGYITNSVPFSVQRLGTETFVTVSVGKAFQVYNVRSFSHYTSFPCGIFITAALYPRYLLELFKFTRLLLFLLVFLILTVTLELNRCYVFVFLISVREVKLSACW